MALSEKDICILRTSVRRARKDQKVSSKSLKKLKEVCDQEGLEAEAKELATQIKTAEFNEKRHGELDVLIGQGLKERGIVYHQGRTGRWIESVVVKIGFSTITLRHLEGKKRKVFLKISPKHLRMTKEEASNETEKGRGGEERLSAAGA